MKHEIDTEKLSRVVDIFNAEVDPEAATDVIESEICADRNEGDEHQEWINNDTASEISDWLSSFYEAS